MTIRILRKPEVVALTGFSKSTLYNRIKQGLWPEPISLGARAVGFIQGECQLVLQAMTSAYTPEQIKEIVKQLKANRSKKKQLLQIE